MSFKEYVKNGENLSEGMKFERITSQIFSQIENLQKMTRHKSVFGHLALMAEPGLKDELDKIESLLDDLHAEVENVEMIVSKSQ